MRDILYDRMTKIIGSPNNISHSAICAEAEKFGPYYTEGIWGYRQYDVVNTRYMLLWGADPLAANRQVSYYSQVWGIGDRSGPDRRDRTEAFGHRGQGRRLDARQTRTGRRPGGRHRSHVILTEGLWYKEFVGDFKDGQNLFVAGQDVNEEDFEENYTPRPRQVVESGAEGQNTGMGCRAERDSGRADPTGGHRLRPGGAPRHVLGGRRPGDAGARRLHQS